MSGPISRNGVLAWRVSVVAAATLLFPVVGSAVEKEETSRTLTTGSSIPEAAVLFVAVLGGLVAVFGIVMVFRGVGGKADVDISVAQKGSLALKNVTQGVIVVIVGAAIILGSFYFLRVTKEETHSEKTKIIYGPDGDKKMAE